MYKLKTLFASASALAVLPVLLTGCATSFNDTLSGTASVPGASIRGTVMGGQQPIKGAHIFLFATGSTGYGSSSTSLLQAPGAVVNGHTVSNTALDSNGFYYVPTSNTDGSFNISSDYTCPQQNSQIYLLSTGGDPGVGSSNAAAILMAALGTCGNLSSGTFVTINELTTVAGVTALQQFISGPLAIGTSAVNQAGLQHAFLTAMLMVNINNGVANATLNGITFPSAKVYTLGNAMAGCVNTAGSSSSGCNHFFTGAIDESNPGNTPTNTFNAMLNIARYPAADTADIILAIPPTSAFGASLSSVNDFSLPIVYTGGGLLSATGIAVDGNGDVWVANCGLSCDGNTQQQDDLVKITPYSNYNTGAIASGAGVGVGKITFAQGIAIDQNNYVWLTDTTPSVQIYRPNGTQFAQYTTAPTNYLTAPEGIAIDTNGTAWYANSGISGSPTNVVSLNTSSGFGFALTDAGLTNGYGVAIAPQQPYGNIILTDVAGGGTHVYSPNGTPPTSYTASVGNVTAPMGAVELDATGNIWTVDPTGPAIYKLNSSANSAYTASAGVTPSGAALIQGLYIDGLNNAVAPVCAANCNGTGPDSLVYVDQSGSFITGRTGLQDASLNNPVAVAVDGSGNVWVANTGTGAVTEFVGISGPVQTPLSAALTSQTLGQRP